MKQFFLIILIFLVIGCAHTYEMKSGGGQSSTARLSRDVTIYVSLPKDGRYGNQVYVSSGMMTTQEIAKALSVHASKVLSANSFASLKENLLAARTASAGYLLQPTILHWEDRSTEWSGRPDQISIRLELVKVATGESVNTTVISGKSKWATLDGDHLQDLLPEPLKKYAKVLFTS